MSAQGCESSNSSLERKELIRKIVSCYVSNMSTVFGFESLSFSEEVKEMLRLPMQNGIFDRCRINKSQILEAFLSFLLHLLYHKTHLIVLIVGPFKDGIEKLEKELRYLLTILGDISWTLDDENDAEFQNLLPQFEAMADQAGRFVHYLLFGLNFEEMEKRLDPVLKHIDLLEANLESYVRIAAYATPTTSMVDSILILDSVVDDLEDLLKREDDPIADVKDQVNLLHQELQLSHSSIKDMTSPQPSEIEQLKEPLMRIGGIAHQAEYLITAFSVKDAPLWYVLQRLTDLNHRIQPITMELQVITQKCQSEGLKVAKSFTAELSIDDKRVNDIVVGFKEETTKILDQLVGGPGSESLQIISIFGMPGLGKTTLSKKLYNHSLVKYTFDKLAWCVVSQTYKKQSVLAKILIHINSELDKYKILEMEEISLKECIFKTLKERRYLIVLDDLWDSNVIDELLRCFPDDVNGSRILLTSRNKDVAPPNAIKHELPFLTDEQCFELLEMKVFGSRTCPPQLQGIGRKIAANCCRLPLTVVVIAGVLSGVDEEESAWERVGGSLASYTDNSVMQILELSYKHLPDHLKPCFLYFGGFDEDKEIHVGELKRLWAAEGFIRKEKGKSAENIAREYLMELIDKSLVIIGKRKIDGSGAKSCVVHDLLRELCLKKSKEESFLKYLDNDHHTFYEKSHRVRVDGGPRTLTYYQHVRSYVHYFSSPSLYFCEMRLLKVLNFKGFHTGVSRTYGIEYLVKLRYLVTFYLPTNWVTWIDRLVYLEYLHVRSWKQTVYLPPTIGKMKKLRYLRAPCVEYGEDWNISNQTNNLKYLSKITIKKLKDEELLKCSPHLRKLNCIYDQNGVDKSAYPSFDLRFLSQLHSLYLEGDIRKADFGFPSNLRKLTLFWTRLPWEKITIIGKLEFLEVLKLSYRSFLGERWDTRDGEFQKLRFLQLDEIHLSEWNVASNEHFPKLQRLILTRCKNLQEIPSEVGEITTLELIKVKRGCLKSVAESAERIKEEQQDMGNEDLRVIIEGSYHSPHTTVQETSSETSVEEEELVSPNEDLEEATRDFKLNIIESGVEEEELVSPNEDLKEAARDFKLNIIQTGVEEEELVSPNEDLKESARDFKSNIIQTGVEEEELVSPNEDLKEAARDFKLNIIPTVREFDSNKFRKKRRMF